jgi:hypothetical protein
MAPDRDDDKGFTVTDRRQFSGTGEPAPAGNDEAPAAGAPAAAAAATPGPAPGPTPAPAPEPPVGGRPKRAPLPEIDFATFILSLGTSVLYHLGEMPGPEGEKATKNLPLAKQTIDILALLQQKTRGNLAPDEAQLLDSLLYDLRIKYVAATK